MRHWIGKKSATGNIVLDNLWWGQHNFRLFYLETAQETFVVAELRRAALELARVKSWEIRSDFGRPKRM